MTDHEAGQEVDLDRERFRKILDTFVELPTGTSLMLYRRLSDGQMIGSLNILTSDDQIWQVGLQGGASMAQETLNRLLLDPEESVDEVDTAD